MRRTLRIGIAMFLAAALASIGAAWSSERKDCKKLGGTWLGKKNGGCAYRCMRVDLLPSDKVELTPVVAVDAPPLELCLDGTQSLVVGTGLEGVDHIEIRNEKGNLVDLMVDLDLEPGWTSTTTADGAIAIDGGPVARPVQIGLRLASRELLRGLLFTASAGGEVRLSARIDGVQATRAGTPVSDVHVILQKIPASLIVDPRDGDGIDEVCVGVPRKTIVVGIREVVPGDAGWLLDTSTAGRVCAGRLDGIAARPVIFELASPLRKDRFAVTIQGGGEVLFDRGAISSRDLEPLMEVLDSAAVLDFPTEVTRGRVAIASVRSSVAVPKGGTWSFGRGIRGVVLEALAGEDEAPAGTLSSGAAIGSYPAALVQVRPVADGKPDREKMEVAGTGDLGDDSGGRGSLGGFVLEAEDLDAVEQVAGGEEALVFYVETSFGAGWIRGPVAGPEDAEAEPAVTPVPLRDFLAELGGKARDVETLGGGDPLKGLNVSGPVKSSPPCKPAASKGQRGATITVPFDCPVVAPGDPTDTGDDGERGLDLESDEVTIAPLRITYTDRYGRVVADGQTEVISRPAWPRGNEASAGEAPRPRIVLGTEMVFAGQEACVCGQFPQPRHWRGVRLDDQPLDLRSATPTVVSFTLPADAAPGQHLVAGAPSVGFTEDDRWRVTALQIQGSLDQDQLRTGGATTMHLEILGTAEPLAVRLLNLTPAVISFEGGDAQVATSSGGELNRIERTVSARGAGEFNIKWALATDSCPCSNPEILLRSLNVCQIVKGQFGFKVTDCRIVDCGDTYCTCEELNLASDQACWLAPSFLQYMR